MCKNNKLNAETFLNVTFTLSWILWSIQLSFTSNLLGGCSNTAVGLSSSVMPSLVSLCVASSWLKLRPIILRSSKSAALLSLVSLHTLFSRLRDFSMDFLGMGSPFFTSTNNLIKKNKKNKVQFHQSKQLNMKYMKKSTGPPKCYIHRSCSKVPGTRYFCWC